METTREVTGILHCHSTYSYDGKLSLPELRKLFLERGVSFVCMTEHTDEMDNDSAASFMSECESLSDETFRFIPGFEVPYRNAHVLMIGCRTFHERYAPSIAELRPWVDDAAFVVLAHPVRNDFVVDKDLLASINALEVWNQQYEGKHVPRVRGLALFSELKKEKERLLATGGVDLHRREHMGTPVVSIHLADLTERAILEKLMTGTYAVHSPSVRFFGTLPDALAVARSVRFRSHVSVAVIVLGKFVNKSLARLGLRFPKSLKQLVRKFV